MNLHINSGINSLRTPTISNNDEQVVNFILYDFFYRRVDLDHILEHSLELFTSTFLRCIIAFQFLISPRFNFCRYTLWTRVAGMPSSNWWWSTAWCYSIIDQGLLSEKRSYQNRISTDYGPASEGAGCRHVQKSDTLCASNTFSTLRPEDIT